MAGSVFHGNWREKGEGGRGGWDVAARGIFLWALASSFPFNRLGLLDTAGVGEVISLHGRSFFSLSDGYRLMYVFILP